MIDLLKQYVDYGHILPDYQLYKLPKNLLNTYISKRTNLVGFPKEVDKNILISGLQDNLFSDNTLKKIVKDSVNCSKYFKYIDSPSEDVQIAAIKSYPPIIDFIDNPSENVQLALVNISGYLIEDIYKKGIEPSDNVKIGAVKKTPAAIQYIEDPSESLQILAVTKSLHAFRHIKNPTETVKSLYDSMVR